MADWKKETHRLRPDHPWKAKPGYSIFVMDRGAVRFSIPTDWVIVPQPHSVQIHDHQPPEDNCRIEASFLRIPPIDWSGLPLSKLIEDVVEREDRSVIGRSDLHSRKQPFAELAWIEVVYLDPSDPREARGRICIARHGDIQALITFDLWAEHAERLDPIWEELIESLELAHHVENPLIEKP